MDYMYSHRKKVLTLLAEINAPDISETQFDSIFYTIHTASDGYHTTCMEFFISEKTG